MGRFLRNVAACSCAVVWVAVLASNGPRFVEAGWPDPPAMPADPVFEAPVAVTASPDFIDTLPTLAVDRCGNVHIAYLGSYVKEGAPDGVARDVFYTNNLGGVFSAPVKVEVPTGWYSHGATLAVDPEGVAHIAFRRADDQIFVTSDDDLYYVNNASGSFDSPLMVVDGYHSGIDPYLSTPDRPMLAVGPDGVVHLAFLAESNVLYGANVFYSNDGGSGVFAEPVIVSAGMANPQTDNQMVSNFTMVLDAQSWPHFAFYGTPDWENVGNGVFYVKAVAAPVPSPAFSTPEGAFTADYLLDVLGPALAIDNVGDAHIVFRQPFPGVGNPSLYWTNNTGGTFTTPEGLEIDGSPSFGFVPWLEIDRQGNLHLAYKTGSPFYQAYANNIGGGWGGTQFANVFDYSGYATRHFALGPGGELDIVYADTLTGYLEDFHIYFVAGNVVNAVAPCEVFTDGFESGDCTEWSLEVP